MTQLPCARHAQHGELDERPPNNLAVRGFTLVSELCFAFLRCVSISNPVVVTPENLHIPVETPVPS
jgi:hypothetical protein